MLESDEWSIYRFKNFINGKEYYGQDKSGRRVQNHLWCAERGCPSEVRGGCNGSSKLHRAIRSYGIESFNVDIMEVGFSSQKEINLIEDSYIIGNDSLIPHGYNSRTNGHSEGGSGTVSKEKYEMILNHIPAYHLVNDDLPAELKDGFGIKTIRSLEREIPEWALSNKEVRRVLMTAFPKLSFIKPKNLNQKAKTAYEKRIEKAGRWARIIHLYYRMVLPTQIVAKEMKIKKTTLDTTLRNINRVERGLRADGIDRKRIAETV